MMITIILTLGKTNYPIGISYTDLLNQQLKNKSELFDYLKDAIIELKKDSENEVVLMKLNRLKKLLNTSVVPVENKGINAAIFRRGLRKSIKSNYIK